MLNNLPNFITLGRVISVPVIFWLLVNGHARSAFIVFLLAGISDGVDGYLAKRFRWTSELGAYLDPLADKLLIVSIYIALAVAKQIPLWLTIAVVSRDILILLAVLLSWLIGRPFVIKPLTISKINTAAQLVLATTVLGDNAFNLGLEVTRLALVWITGVSTVLSLAAYMQLWVRHMAGHGDGDSSPQ
ncbi:MAG TPA: CDP-alcohol phosphatidyltransferase family protein [Hyphomicrobiaceae bacterium]|nr:CDP-alcohol phosphatidyltransferase family protein [Hyphomicrobiaceae bacterium]